MSNRLVHNWICCYSKNFRRYIRMRVEKGLLYTEDHDWVKVEGNIVTVGFSLDRKSVVRERV